jgi:hypothetical protein
MRRLHELDGFHLLSGLMGVVAGPIMLLSGAPAGWAFLVIGAGALVLLAQWAIIKQVTFDQPDATTIGLMAVGAVCIAIAIVYLTRAANDLPAIFPGYDHDSENFRLIPGTLTAAVGVVAVARAVAGVHPTSHAHH